MLADPEWRARAAEKRAEVQRASRENRVAQAPLLADLRSVGVEVDDVWVLVNTSTPYPAAIPVLVEHLHDTSYPDRVRAGIARALAVRKVASPWWEEFRALFLTQPGGWAEEGLAVALTATAEKEH